MGSRVVVSVGIVLLIAGGKICAAENQVNGSANGSLNQTWPDGAGPQPRTHVSYRVRIYQLQRPAAETEEAQKPLKDPQRSEDTGHTTSEPPGVEEPVHRPISIQGPDLNPPLGPETRVRVITDHRVPVPASSVAAQCREEDVLVAVKQDFLGNGQLIHPTDLTLGGCAARPASDSILGFQTELHGCNSTSWVTEDALIYSFLLVYLPTPIGNTVILKTNPAEVLIECLYQSRRKGVLLSPSCTSCTFFHGTWYCNAAKVRTCWRHYVSSNALRPTWMLFAAMMQAEKQQHFSLRLTTEDWQSPRESNVFFLSDTIRIEAAVLRGFHVPLRIYVDSCAATAGPNPDSQPRYPFITNHGCLNDSKQTGAKSVFLQRSQEDKLQFQLKAFRFHQNQPGNNSIYITCHLKAMTLSAPVDSQHKACSFLTEASRWVASDGDNLVCRCCETGCDERKRKRRLAADVDFPVFQREGRASLEVILLEEDPPELPPEPAPQSPTASSSSAVLLRGAGTMVALVLLAFLGAVVCIGMSKPTVYTVST